MNAPLVVKLGGALMDDAAALTTVCAAIAGMHAHDQRSVVVVHGGGSAVDRQLAALGMATERREGIRITPPDQMLQIAGVLGGHVNAQLVASLMSQGSRACGLRLSDAGVARCRVTRRYSFDPGCVGEVHGGDPRAVHALLDLGVLPVFSSIGTDDDGTLLNVNADDAAAAIAKILGARGLVFLTDVSGVQDASGALLPELAPAAVEALIADGTIRGGMIPKVRGALDTATAIGAPVTIASWLHPERLVSLARGESVGTRIHAAHTSTAASTSHRPCLSH